MKTIYIAHPLHGDDTPEWGNPDRNVERYLRFCALASNQGYAVVSWVHHYLMHTRGLTQGDSNFYLERDRELLKSVDELWVCGPPEVSSGTQYEIACAKEFGIRIVQRPEWMSASFLPDVE